MCGSVLLDHLVDSPGDSFWIVVRKVGVVIEEESGVIYSFVKSFEVPRIVRTEDDVVFTTPAKQLHVTGSVTEAVFRLVDAVLAFPKNAFEDPPDLFVEEYSWPSGHETGSLGFSDVSRMRSNDAAFSRSSARISSILS